MGCGGSKEVARAVRKDPVTPVVTGGAPQSPGKLLDKYTLGKVLGQGAFGVVYKCKKKGTDEEFAVKMIDQVETPLADIKREAEMLYKLDHPTVIKLHDVFYEKVFVCMVLEYYAGGDMIQGMMAHWKAHGMIPIANVKHLSKQMHAAVAWLHSKQCVHRDIKGDNYMMERPNVENPQQRLYLSDFGTVREVAPGERMTQKCGTKNYWPPEFYKMNYGIKVDCWAVGVVMFGLVSGKFPFKGEDDVRFKQLVVPRRCPPDGQALINSLLERDETNRKDCAEALRHTFLTDAAMTTPHALERMETDFLPDIKETGANAGVQQRRAELVNRLQAAEGKGGGRRESVVRNGNDKTFTCTDLVTDRSTTFEWWAARRTSHMTGVFERGKQLPADDFANLEVTEETVKQQLRDHNVNVDGFGKGPARRFDEFVAEIQNGSSRLLLDATKHKHVVRAVDVVLVKILYSQSSEGKYLVEVTEGLQTGQIAAGPALPGDVKLPVESTLQTAERLAQAIMGGGDCQIKWKANSIETFEESENSPAYPGIQTVYRKEVLSGQVLTTNAAFLHRVGLLGGTSKFVLQDGERQRTFEWLTEARCASKGVRLASRSSQDFSALVYPPIGLEEEELNEFLKKNQLDTSQWGTGTYKTLADFSEELVKGESTLIRQASGRMARVVDIVVLELTRRSTGQVLVEASENFRDCVQPLDRLPAVKRRSDEHQFHTARRMVHSYLKLDDNLVSLDPTDVRLVEEEQESKAYPGLATIYRKRFVRGVLQSEAAPKQVDR